VARTAVGAEVDETLDVHRHLLPQFPLDAVFALENVTDAGDVPIGEILGPDGAINASLLEESDDVGTADAVEVGQG